MATTDIDKLRKLIQRDMELIQAFLATDQQTAIDHLVKFGQSQGIVVTAAEISAAIKAKQGGGLGSSSRGTLLGHHPSSANTTPF